MGAAADTAVDRRQQPRFGREGARCQAGWRTQAARRTKRLWPCSFAVWAWGGSGGVAKGKAGVVPTAGSSTQSSPRWEFFNNDHHDMRLLCQTPIRPLRPFQ